MDRATVESKVKAVLVTVLGAEIGSVGDATRQTLLDWNSLKHLEIMFAVEEELGVEFTEDELAELDSAEKIVNAALARHET